SAVVEHGFAGPCAVAVGVVQPMKEEDLRRGDGRSDSGGDAHDLASGRYWRVVQNSIHLRAGQWNKARVTGAGGAEVRWHGQGNAGRNAVIPGLNNKSRRAGHPTGVETDFVTRACGHARNVNFRPIGAIVSVAIGNEV